MKRKNMSHLSSLMLSLSNKKIANNAAVFWRSDLCPCICCRCFVLTVHFNFVVGDLDGFSLLFMVTGSKTIAIPKRLKKKTQLFVISRSRDAPLPSKILLGYTANWTWFPPEIHPPNQKIIHDSFTCVLRLTGLLWRQINEKYMC